ncbi:MAG: chitobiase/beta-hexosaminidase C-terminal domain-containing protein [Kiritimatiellae bacterium]|nr:chitobiase/beta-hexosaminidase C-terminal domain-containing protein [Kiritimatiellia bacterium]
MKKGLSVVCLFTVLFCVPLAYAVVYVDVNSSAPVPDGGAWGTAYASVQAGIDAAEAGEEIWVAAGVYDENLTVSKPVALYGGFTAVESARGARNWAANPTVIDGGHRGCAVRVSGGIAGQSLIDGFIIRNGVPADPAAGGGVWLEGSPLELQHMVLRQNERALIVQSGAIVLVANSLFAGNDTAVETAGALVKLVNNTFAENTGMTLSLTNSLAASVVHNNVFAFNQSLPALEALRAAAPGAVKNNCIWTEGLQSPAEPGNDIYADPLFVDRAAADRRLQPASPCVDTGDNGVVGVQWTDLGGTDRIRGFRSDIGAYESGYVATVPKPGIAPHGGTFTDSIEVTLTAPSPDAQIHYTTDGSEPVESSPLYAGTPLTVTHSMDLRVRSFAEGAGSTTAAARFARRLCVDGAATGSPADGRSWATAYRTIQDAMDAAEAKDEIWVAAGTYTNLLYTDKELALYGGFGGSESDRDQRDWRLHETTIDAGGRGRALFLYVFGPRSMNAVVDGFVIKNGRASGDRGGGLYCIPGATIAHNRFEANHAGSGGAICMYAEDRGLVHVHNNVFLGNTAEQSGGAICSLHDAPLVVNNTFVSNAAPNGGAMACDGGSTRGGTAINNIFAGNSSGLYLSRQSKEIVQRCNCHFGNQDYNQGGFAVPDSSDIPADPQFLDEAAGDYRLQAGSACVDAGFYMIPGVHLDLAGQPRFAGQDIDVGAFEASGSPLLPVPSITPNGGTHIGPVAVEILTDLDGATLTYTLDGTDPTASSLEYLAPICFGENRTLKARAFKAGFAPSPLVEASFVILDTYGQAFPFTAYDDLAWFDGQPAANITICPVRESGAALIDYRSGQWVGDVSIQVTGGATNDPSYASEGGNAGAGTDADALFGGVLDATGILGQGADPIRVSFSGLTPDLWYDLAFYCSRSPDSMPVSHVAVQLSGVDSFENTSSAGAAVTTTGGLPNDTTTLCSTNRAAGLVARFSRIRVGDTRQIVAVLSSPETSVFANAVRLEGAWIDYLDRIRDESDFHMLSLPFTAGTVTNRETLYIAPARSDTNLLGTVYANQNLYPLHAEFLREVFPERFSGLSVLEYFAMTQNRATRDYYAGFIQQIEHESLGRIYGFNAPANPTDPAETLTVEEVAALYQTIDASFELGPLYYTPQSLTSIASAREWVDPPFPVLLPEPEPDPGYEAYTTAVNYGTIRRLTLEQLDQAVLAGTLSWQDIVVLDRAPFDLETVVAGVITAERQTDLSHVNVRSARRGTPNAYVNDALAAFAPYEGLLVRLAVGETGYTVSQESDPSVAEAYWDRHRPYVSAPVVQPDYTVTDFMAVQEASPTAPVSALAALYGGKAANLMVGYRYLAAPYQVQGFGIPFTYYRQFMRQNVLTDAHFDPGRVVTYEEYVRRLSQDSAFNADPGLRQQILAGFRDQILAHSLIDPALVQSLANRITAVFGSPNVSVRFRSSSNAEDDLEFSAAGLHDSTTVVAADSLPGGSGERTIEDGLRTVWASLWNFRAYEERSYYHIRQTDVSMAILVTTAFPDEQANGVAFSGDPTGPGTDYLVNANPLEYDVVRPEPGTLPEKVLLRVESGAVTAITRVQGSTYLAAGEDVLDDGQLQELGAAIHAVDTQFPFELQGYRRADVLLDVEFKIDRNGALKIKQFRPFLKPTAERPVGVASFTLIDADRDVPVPLYDPIMAGDAINLHGLPTANLTLRANVTGEGVGVVVFGWDGTASYSTQISYPYAINGQTAGDYHAWTLPVGRHSVSAVPYLAETGEPGLDRALLFEVVDAAPAPSAWSAYNDVAWRPGQLAANITRYTTASGGYAAAQGLGEEGNLIDFDTGGVAPVRLRVSGGTLIDAQTLQGTNLLNQEAAAVFAGRVDAQGVISYGPDPVLLELSGLEPDKFYDLVLYGNRARPAYTSRFTRFTLEEAAAFKNTTVFDEFAEAGPRDPSVVILNGDNTLSGYVARYRNVRDGDGHVRVRVSDDVSPDAPRFYLSAVSVHEQRAAHPDAWRALYATTRSVHEVQIGWEDGGPYETGWHVYRSPDAVAWTQVGGVPADTFAFLDQGLPPGTRFYYRVAAVTAEAEVFGRGLLDVATKPWSPGVDPLINEFVASNNSSPGGFQDEDGDWPDWIEIYNPAARPVSLNGWRLRDDAHEWIFPDVSIAARGYLVVFASDKNRRDPLANLHTNFKLDKDGDELVLVRPDGTVAQAFTPFPPLGANQSYGRESDVPDAGYAVFYPPTPGSRNVSGPIPVFAAYNDLSWGTGQTQRNITLYTTPEGGAVLPQGDSGPLVDCQTGELTPVTLTVAGGSWIGGAHAEQGALSAPGTDAYAVFAGMLDARGVVSYGTSDVVLAFSGLNENLRYNLVVFGNRDRAVYTDRITRVSLLGADAFVNRSTPGAGFSDSYQNATVIVNGYNTTAGYVARFADIAPGNDGAITAVVSDGGSASPPRHYVNAVCLETVWPAAGANDAPEPGPATTPSTDAAPAPPSDFSAYAVSPSEIRLSWTDCSSNEENIKIRRSLDGVDFWHTIVLPVNTSGYTDRGLTPGQTYTYAIEAEHSTRGDSTSVATTCIAEHTPLLLFAAYNDLAWFSGQSALDITTYTTGTGGALIDRATGRQTAVSVAVSAGGSVEPYGAHPAPGTEAHALFDGKVDCAGTLSGGSDDLILTFTGLDPALRYELALYADRDNPDATGDAAQWHHGTLVGAADFRNAAAGLSASLDGCTLWNRLGSEDQILNSEVGPGLATFPFAARGFNTVQHGAGVGVSTGADQHCVCVSTNDMAAILDPERGCVEAWFKQTEDPLAYHYGVYRLFNGAHGLPQCSVSLAIHDPSYNNDGWVNGMVWFGGIHCKVGWAPGGHVRNNHPYNNVPVHVALVWDRQGIEGGLETVRLYANGARVCGATENGWGTQVSGYGDIGSGQDGEFADRFWVDNLKVWAYAKTNFNDRYSEGPPNIRTLTRTMPDDTTAYNAGYNNGNGYVTRFVDVIPETAGALRLVVEQDAAAHVLACANAFMLRAYEQTGPAAIAKGSIWKYRRGTAEASVPPFAWWLLAFDDAGWATGPAPIGYSNYDVPIGTPLSDMQNAYSSFFMRRSFMLTDAANVDGLQLEVDFDDGFILWVNGSEVARINVPGVRHETVSFDELALSNSNGTWTATLCDGTLPPLVEGANVVTLHVFNRSLNSGDCYADVQLTAVDRPRPVEPPPPSEGMPEPNPPSEDREVEPAPGTPAAARGSDADGDGLSDEAEFIAGTDSLDATDRFVVDATLSNGALIVSFPTVQAAGTRCEGWTRYYALEQCAGEPDADWTVAPGYGRIAGMGQTVVYTNDTVQSGPCLYRAKVWLEEAP